jgi:hypothetical protein
MSMRLSRRCATAAPCVKWRRSKALTLARLKAFSWAVNASRLLKHIPAQQEALTHDEGKGGANAETLSPNLA